MGKEQQGNAKRILARHLALLQEPWCLSWDYVAWLTWKQVDEQYIQPAIERSEQLKSGQKQAPQDLPDDGRPLTLDEFKQLCWEAHSGWTEQQWREGYRKYLAEEGE